MRGLTDSIFWKEATSGKAATDCPAERRRYEGNGQAFFVRFHFCNDRDGFCLFHPGMFDTTLSDVAGAYKTDETFGFLVLHASRLGRLVPLGGND